MAELQTMNVYNDPSRLGYGGLSVATLDNPYEPWLGPVPQSFMSDSNYGNSGRPQTIRNLPEYYKGRNVRILSFIEEQIFFNEQFLSQVILPIKETEEFNFEWNIWKFDSHLLNPVPYQGVSRYISSETSQGRKSTTRYGIAFTLEHEFMKTEAGRTNYDYNIQSIANSVNETNNLDILRAIISSDQEYENYARSRGFYEDKSFQDVMDLEKNNFALLQKDFRGFQKLDTETIERMRFNGGEADTWLVPPKMSYYARLGHRESTDAYIAGDIGPKRLAGTKASYDSPNAFQTFGDALVYYVRQFNYDHHQHVDAMARYRQIGEYNTMLPIGSVETKSYSSKERNIVIYNEDRDDWHLLTLRSAIENCRMFKQYGENDLQTLAQPRFSLSDDGYRNNPFFMSVTSGPSDNLDGDNEDQNSGPSNWRPIQIFGQMKPKDLHMTTQKDLAGTILERAKGILGLEVEQEIERLISNFETINSTVWSSRADLIRWWSNTTGITKKKPGFTANDTVLVKPSSERTHRFAAHLALPYDLNKGYTNRSSVIESKIGLSNWFGLSKLTDHNGVGKDFVTQKQALSAVVKQINRLLPGCLLTDKNKTPGHFPVASQEEVFLENALGQTGFPVWVNVGIPWDDSDDGNPGIQTFIDDTDVAGEPGFVDKVAEFNKTFSDGSKNDARILKELNDIKNPFSVILLRIIRTVESMKDPIYTESIVKVIKAINADTRTLLPFEDKDTKEAINKNIQIHRFLHWLSPFAFPVGPDNNKILSYESFQRFKNFASVMNYVDTNFLKKKPGLSILSELTKSIVSLLDKYNLSNDIVIKPLLDNPADIPAFLETLPASTKTIDNVLYGWLVNHVESGLFDFGSVPPREKVNSIIREYQTLIDAAVSTDRVFAKKGISSKFAITGTLKEEYVKTHTREQILDHLNTKEDGTKELNIKFQKLGSKFGEEEDEDMPPTEDLFEDGKSGQFVRTTLSLSPQQVSQLYQLQFAQKGQIPCNLVGVSLPDNPEVMASPGDLARFHELYKRQKSGDIESLPKNTLTGLMLGDDEKRMRVIEFTSIYGSHIESYNSSRNIMETGGGGHLRKRRGGSLITGDTEDEDDVIYRNNTNGVKRRKLSEKGAFGALTGTDLGLRSTTNPLSIGTRSYSSNNDMNTPLLTSELISHWDTIAKSGQSSAIKAIMRSLLMTPFSKNCLLALNDNDCIVPVGFLIFAPHMTYLTLLAIKILAGERTGNLMVGHQDFEIGSNMKTKVFFGHFTIHCVPIIHHPQNIFVFYDAFVKGCYGGAGITFWNEENASEYRPDEDETLAADRFSIMVSYEEDRSRQLRNPCDASGRFSYYNSPGLLNEPKVAHYSTAEYYNALWGFRKPDAFARRNVSTLSLHHPWHEKAYFREFRYNTVMWHGAQAHYNRSKQMYDNLKVNTGHWGETGYGPGAKSVRQGDLKGFKTLSDIKSTLHH